MSTATNQPSCVGKILLRAVLRLAGVLVLAMGSLTAASYQLRGNDFTPVVANAVSGNYHLRAAGMGVVSTDETRPRYQSAVGQVAQLRMIFFVNSQPTLDSIIDSAVLEDCGITIIGLTGITDGSATENQQITVSATSSNASLISSPSVTYNSPATTATLQFAPEFNQYGTTTITVRAVDAGGTLNGSSNAITQTFTITVLPVNDAPYAGNSTVASLPGVSVSSLLPGNDYEDDALTYALVSQPSSGSVTMNDASTGAVTWTPGNDWQSNFTYQITDDEGATSAVITVTAYVATTDGPRPQAVSSPPMSATVGDDFTYNVVVDTSHVGGTPALDFELVGEVPTGMTVTPTGNATAQVDWTGNGVIGEHHEFGVLFVDPAAQKVGYQPIHYVLQQPLVFGDG